MVSDRLRTGGSATKLAPDLFTAKGADRIDLGRAPSW